MRLALLALALLASASGGGRGCSVEDPEKGPGEACTHASECADRLCVGGQCLDPDAGRRDATAPDAGPADGAAPDA